MRCFLAFVAATWFALVSGAAQAQQQAAPLTTQTFLLKAAGSDTLSAGTTSSRVALSSSSSPTVWVTNTGAVAACIKLGSSSVVAALPCPVGFLVGPGQTLTKGIAANADLAAITASGTAALVINEGYLTPALSP